METEHRLKSGNELLNLVWAHRTSETDHSIKSICLTIKITASSSLYKVLRNKDLKECFKPELPRILEAYLHLIDKVDNDELISGLEEIVNIYEDSIEPFALELCQKIVENYK